MTPATKQSLTTWLASGIGALLVPAVAKRGFNMTPVQVNAFAAYLVGGGVVAFGALGHWIGGIIHQKGTLPAPVAVASASSSTKVGAALTALFLVGLVMSLGGLTGCATIAKLSTPAYSPYVQVAADVAVSAAVGSNAATQKANAVKIKAIAQQVLAADTGVTSTLSALQAVANVAIAKASLSPADVQAAQLLVATLSAVVQTQIISSTTASAVTSQTQVAIALVLNDVITATSAYGA